jgi:hypothetical protein
MAGVTFTDLSLFYLRHTFDLFIYIRKKYDLCYFKKEFLIMHIARERDLSRAIN